MSYTIGIVGQAGAGKDTLACAMREMFQRYGEARVVSFAAPIRSIAAAIGLDPYDRATKEEQKVFEWDCFVHSFRMGVETTLVKLGVYERQALYDSTVAALTPFVVQTNDRVARTHLSISPREFMQVLGTEGGQSVRKTIWVDLLKPALKTRRYNVIPDVRFRHELPVLDCLVALHRADLPAVSEHSSEDFARSVMNRPASVCTLEGVPVIDVYNDADIRNLMLEGYAIAARKVLEGEQ